MEDCRRLFKNSGQFAFVIVTVALALVAAGCGTQEETTPPRSATEQLLLSSAADQAVADVNLNLFSGRKVYVDLSYFEGYDQKYAEGAIRDALSRGGALLATNPQSADIILEARSGAYSIDTNSFYIGIPAIPIPIPGTAEMPMTPRIAFYSRDSLDSYAKFALLAYANKSRALVFSSGPLDGKSYNTYRSFLIFSWWRTDIPEKVKRKYKQNYIVWQPQFGLTNMPPRAPPPP